MAVLSYVLEGEGVCQEKHCRSWWCTVREAELSRLQLPQDRTVRTSLFKVLTAASSQLSHSSRVYRSLGLVLRP